MENSLSIKGKSFINKRKSISPIKKYFFPQGVIMAWLFYVTLTIIFFCSFGNPIFVEYQKSRFSKIYLPKSNFTQIGEIFSYTVFTSPFSNQKNLNKTTELCQKASDDLKSFDPNLWNSTDNPCRVYFCDKRQIHNNSFIHYSAHRYCLQCSISNENFTFNESCPNIDKKCLNHCTKESDCIYYDKDLTLCYYRSKNIFYSYDDFTHLHYLQFLSSPPIILAIIGVITWILMLFLMIIPNILKTYYDLKIKGLSFFEKLKIIFSFQNQTYFLLSLCPPIIIISSIIDIISSIIDDAVFLNAVAFGIYINAAILLLAIICLVINWFYVVKLMDFNPGQETNYMRYFFLQAVSIFVFITLGLTLVISYALYRIVDKGSRGTWIYITGSAVLFIIVVISIIVIALFILSILVLFNLSKVQSQNENVFELAIQLKVSLHN